MKHFKLFLLFTLCFSSCIEENPAIMNDEDAEFSKSYQDENEGRSQEAAEEAYNSLQSLINQETRSGSNEIEQWYGGAFINDEDILVVKSTDLRLSSKLHLSNTVFEKCDYTMSELNEIKEKITDLFYEGDSFVRDHIILFGPDPVTNSLEIGMDEVSDENKSYFKNNISSCPAVSFVKCSRPIFTSTELECGDTVTNLTKIVGFELFGASLGYRARKKDTGEIGVVTAGHFISKGQILGTATKDTIGICVDSRNLDGCLDAAFCKIINPDFEPTNKIDFMVNPEEDILSTELATPPVGKIVNMVGHVSHRKSGRVYKDTYNLIDKSTQVTLVRDVLIMTCIPQKGDSGGIVYALNKQTNVRYTVGIISGQCDLYENGQIPNKYGFCCKAEVINRLFGLERY